MRAAWLALWVTAGLARPLLAQEVPAAPAASVLLLVPDRVFLGTEDSARTGWAVLVTGDRITAVGPRASLRPPAGARTLALP
ncbi:MAG: hypothetical protein RLZZ25_596, partial [Gemmatimonadota bacterium]